MADEIRVPYLHLLQFEGTAKPSLTSKMIEQNLQENGQILDEDVISRISGTAFAAGADTV